METRFKGGLWPKILDEKGNPIPLEQLRTAVSKEDYGLAFTMWSGMKRTLGTYVNN